MGDQTLLYIEPHPRVISGDPGHPLWGVPDSEAISKTTMESPLVFSSSLLPQALTVCTDDGKNGSTFVVLTVGGEQGKDYQNSLLWAIRNIRK